MLWWWWIWPTWRPCMHSFNPWILFQVKSSTLKWVTLYKLSISSNSKYPWERLNFELLRNLKYPWGKLNFETTDAEPFHWERLHFELLIFLRNFYSKTQFGTFGHPSVKGLNEKVQIGALSISMRSAQFGALSISKVVR